MGGRVASMDFDRRRQDVTATEQSWWVAAVAMVVRSGGF